jgi:imidazolonepropionase-like amidohydrolase
LWSKFTPVREAAKRTYAKAIKMGVNYCLQQDRPKGLIPWSIAYLVTEFGVSPMNAIMAATRSPAECCGVLDDRGTLEPGKYADLISVKGNPLEAIEVILNKGMVMVGGKVFDPVTGFWEGLVPKGAEV